jgi:CHASE2 domain-containing sensor protein
MVKLVILKFGQGSFDRGFPVTLQLGEDGARPSLEITGNLPSNSDIPKQYKCWQASYLLLGLRSRLEAKTNFIINVSQVEDCDRVALKFRDCLNDWLNSDSFRPIREKLLEKLKPTDEIRILLQTENQQLQRLPWHLWDWFDRYLKAEIAVSSPSYERLERNSSVVRNKVRILAIVGNSTDINTESDRALLSQLLQAETTFLVEPDRQTLTEYLWQEKGWDIFFFAGHSSSHTDGKIGQIYLNQIDSLTIAQLKYALKRAAENGLKIAIFNSCDGLGLAHQLADLQIPQILVMREPVPDKVAQEFLKYFLQAFAKGTSFYLAVREAREKLQGLEYSFPCATWLPVIWQNPTEIPINWQKLANKKIKKPNIPVRHKFTTALLTSLAIASLTIGIRYLGILQPVELMAFDRLIQLRPPEKPDPRLLVVTITEADIAAQNPDRRRGSLGDDALDRLLAKIEPLGPRAIGLDIYRDFPVESGRDNLAKRLQTSDNFIAVCKVSDRAVGDLGISPPPEIPTEQIGFSDFVVDNDGRVRRHLFALTPEPTSPCQTSYAFSIQLAFRYLAAEGILPAWTTDERLQLGKILLPKIANNSENYREVNSWGHQILLNYRSLDRFVDRVTLSEILQGKVDRHSVEGRIVLIGTTAASFADYWLTPYSKNQSPQEQTPGVIIQAQMISQILSAVLDDRPLLWMLPQWGEYLWIFVWSLLGSILAWRVKYRSSQFPIAILTTQIILFGICYLSIVKSGCWLPLVPASLGSIAASTTNKVISNVVQASCLE